MLLIPAYLVYVRAVRPVITFYNRCSNATLRALRVRPRDELDVTVSTVELSEMIAESVSEGLLDPEEHTRLTRALQIRNRTVADVAVPVAEIRAVPVAAAGLRADGRGGRKGFGRNRLLPVPGGRRRPTDSSDICTSRMCCRWATTRAPWSTWPESGRCRKSPESLSVPEALSRMRRSNSHLALVTGHDGSRGRDGRAGGSGAGSGRRGARRDAACLTTSVRLDAGQWMARADDYAARVEAFVAPHLERARAGEPHPVWDFLFSYYSLRPGQLRCWHPGYGVLLAGGEAIRRYRDRRGYTVDGVRCHGQRCIPAQPAGHHRVRGAPAACDRAAAGPAELLRAARVGDGLPQWRRAPRPCPAAAGRRRHRHRGRGRDRRAAAVQPLRRVPLLQLPKPRRETPARPAARPNRIGSSPVACTRIWTCTNGPTS